MCHWYTGAYTGSAEFTLPPEMIEQRPVVFDAAYKPARTALLNQVKANHKVLLLYHIVIIEFDSCCEI
jgi:shikimate 5-dehydrogenase